MAGLTFAFGGSVLAAPALAACQSRTGDAYSTSVLADSPVAYYRLNETSGATICDASTSHNNGTYNPTGLTYGVPGALVGDSDTAIAAAGAAGGVGTSSGDSSITGHSTSFSLEAWYRSTGKIQDQVLLGIGSPSVASEGAIVGMATWSNVPAASPCSNQGVSYQSTLALDQYRASNCWNTGAAANPVNLYDGNWHYVAITYNSGTNLLTAYVDGQTLGSQTPYSTINLAPAPVMVGTWVDTAVNQPLNGDLDEVAAYPSALTAAQISAHYEVAEQLATIESFTTPGAYTFAVPPGVTSVQVNAIGAAGGSTPVINFSFNCGPNGAAGGQGASVAGTVAVSGGELLQVGVGAPGTSVSSCATPSAPGAGGYGGGGPGAASSSSFVGGGAGGGGASEVALAAPSSPFDWPLIVAAGGGGAGGLEGSGGGPTSNGGSGGAAGAAATSIWGAQGGGAGTGSAGGSGGSSAVSCGGDGADGASGIFGFGGAGADAGGGGGGGGYYGGGGGEGGCAQGGAGGGGGSSFVASGTLSALPVATAAGVYITYGVPTADLSGPNLTGSGPYGYVFPSQPAQSTGDAEVFTLTDDGAAPLVVSSVGLSGTNPTDFIVQNGCQQPVAAAYPSGNAGTCEIGVRFDPQTADSESSATLTIDSNSINGAAVVSLSGASEAIVSSASAQGPQGPQGSPGTNGQPGATGPQGPPGEVELVTCSKVTKTVKGKKVTTTHCKSKLTSSPQTFSTEVARATLLRSHRVYATGWLRDGKVVLHATRAMRAGRYRLKLTYRSDGRTHTAYETVTVR